MRHQESLVDIRIARIYMGAERTRLHFAEIIKQACGMTQRIKRRAVFFVGGYDPKTPAAFFNRMRKELARSEALWGFAAIVSPVSVSADEEIGTVSIETSGSDAHWAATTDFNFLVLDKIVLADFARPLPVRLGKYLLALGDFIASGTAFRIFVKAWRFGLYFLFPFVTILFFALLGYLAARATAPWLGWGSCVVGLVVYAAAQALLGKRWPVNHLMDLWSFSLNFIRGRRPDAEALMSRFAATIAERTAAGNYDEVILVGHSTGGVLMLDIAARCLALDPEFSKRADHVVLLTLGSTALKAGYHPAAKTFRAGVQSLVDDGRLEWVEIQCLTDVINLYKTDPVAEMRLDRAADRQFPLVRAVRMKDMLQAQTYRRIKRSFFRVHYQYIFGNTERYWYDFFQICCGPTGLLERAELSIVGDMRTERQQPHDA